MADQEQITVEDMATAPVAPVEEQEQPTVAAPAAPATQQVQGTLNQDDLILPEDAATPADPDQVLSQAPKPSLLEQGVSAAREVASPYIESAIEGFQKTFPDSFVNQQVKAMEWKEKNLPAILPKPFVERIRDGELTTQAQIKEAREQMGSIYWNGILSTGDDQRDQRRKEVLNNAVAYAVPRLDPNGQPVMNPQYDPANPQPGVPMFIYDAVVPFPEGVQDTNTRIISLMEAAPNKTGVYHLITPEGGWASPKSLDVGRQEMLREFQDPMSAFFFRVETEEGGMDNYRKVLEQAGIVDPTRQNYYLKQQARANNPLMGIESTRVEANFTDFVGMMANIGMGTPDVVSDFTASIPLYWYSAVGGLANLFSPNKMPYDKVVDVASKEIDNITGGNIDPLYFDSAVDAFARNANVSVEEAEAVLTYSPDLTTTAARFGIDSIATGAPILGVSRALAAKESAKFADWLLQKAGKVTKEDGWATGLGKDLGLSEAKNLDEAIQILEATGMDAQTALRTYIDEVGGTKLGKAYLSDALDLDVQARSMLPGPFRTAFLKPKLEGAARDLTEIESKIESAQLAGRSADYIATLESRRQVIQKTIRNLKEESVLPQVYINYLKDEGLATGAAAVAYQAFYDLGGEDPLISSIGSAAGAVLISLPGVRGSLSASVEDIFVYFDNLGNPEAYRTNSAAVKMRRHVENSPPEVRDSIYAFAEYRALAKEELTKFVYPKGHQLAGQQVISDEAFDQGFWRMSGMLSLRHLRTSQLGDTIDVQKDAGKLSKGLAQIEKNLQQEQKLMNESAELFDQLRYVMFAEDFDPQSPAGQMITTMVGFYDANLKRIADEANVIQTAVEQRKTLLNAFLSGSLETELMEGILSGEEAIADLIRIDRVHYETLNLKPDATVEEKLATLDMYYKDLNQRVVEAIERGRNGRFHGNADTANAQFRFFIESNEQRAYQEASLKFDAIRDNPEYAGARVDMTDVFDLMIQEGEDGITIDARALQNLTAMSGEGTMASRRIGNLQLPSSNFGMVRAVFEDAAGEYLDTVSKYVDAETLERLAEDAGVANGSNIDKFIAVRKFIEDNQESFGDVYENIRPRLGLDVSKFMHVVSGIGARSGDNIMGQQFRQELLERGRTQFYDDFYNPQASRTPLEGFGDDYDAAREYYRTRYLEPFRDMNKKIAQIIREPDAAVRARSFEQFMDEAGLNQPVRSVQELKENLMPVIREITGGKPLDVNSPEGKLVRAFFTKYVQDEIARTSGGLRFQSMLIRNRDAFAKKSALITPEKALEIEAELQSGVTSGVSVRLENLLAKDYDESGNITYVLADDFGNPLVDPKVADMISFENGMMYDQRFRDAAATVKMDIDNEAKEVLKALDDFTSVERQQIEAGKYVVERLEKFPEGAGEGFFKIAQEENGLTKISRLKEDFITTQMRAGVPEDVAAQAFDEYKVKVVTDYIYKMVSRPGENRAFQEIVDGEAKAIVKRTTEIDPTKLFDMLGIRGDTVSKTRNEQIIRTLLGDEMFDHMKMIGSELFTVDVKTGQINVRGISMPLSAESLLSRGTSFFRGVISLRWLVSEAAIRQSRMANMELTKIMLFNPDAGREIVKMITDGNYDVAREPEFVRVLISQIAKNDAVQQHVLRENERAETEERTVQAVQETVSQIPAAADAVGDQMTSLFN